MLSRRRNSGQEFKEQETLSEKAPKSPEWHSSAKTPPGLHLVTFVAQVCGLNLCPAYFSVLWDSYRKSRSSKYGFVLVAFALGSGAVYFTISFCSNKSEFSPLFLGNHIGKCCCKINSGQRHCVPCILTQCGYKCSERL